MYQRLNRGFVSYKMVNKLTVSLREPSVSWHKHMFYVYRVIDQICMDMKRRNSCDPTPNGMSLFFFLNIGIHIEIGKRLQCYCIGSVWFTTSTKKGYAEPNALLAMCHGSTRSGKITGRTWSRLDYDLHMGSRNRYQFFFLSRNFA